MPAVVARVYDLAFYVDSTRQHLFYNSGTASTAVFTELTQNANAAITGGTINATTIGATTPADGSFTTLHASGHFACNGATLAAPASGYGTPIGGSHQESFIASAITLPNLAAAVAQLIIDLKAIGVIVV